MNCNTASRHSSLPLRHGRRQSEARTSSRIKRTYLRLLLSDHSPEPNKLSGSEIAVSFSGGGFSDFFARPSYQDAAVTSYLSNNNLPSTKYYNANGRGIPDVSAVATNFEIVIQGIWGPISGTSAATPLFAGVVSLLNDARYQINKSRLGFVNPLLYQWKSIGTDITSGNNKATGCPEGFPAVGTLHSRVPRVC